MHPDKSFGMRDVRLKLGDRNAGRVRGDNGIGADQAIEFGVEVRLDLDILGDVLDDQVGAINCFVERFGDRDRLAVISDSQLVEHGTEHRLLGQRPIAGCFGYVERTDVMTAACEPGRNARTHRSQTDDCDLHALFPNT